MIKAEQIPDEVAQALIATLYGKPRLPYREAIAAAINAWPGMYDEKDTPWSKASTIYLPLTQETRE